MATDLNSIRLHEITGLTSTLGVGKTRDGQKPVTVKFGKTRDGYFRDGSVTYP